MYLWHIPTNSGTSVFLTSLYGAPLAQRASYFTLHSSLFRPAGAVNYDYIVTNSINSLLIGSRCILNGTHTNHCWPNLAHASKLIKNCDSNIIWCFITFRTFWSFCWREDLYIILLKLKTNNNSIETVFITIICKTFL